MLFQYKAIKDDRVVTKKIEAESEEAVLSFLKDNGYFPIDISPPRSANLSFLSSLFTERVSSSDIVDFTRQLAIMLNAGLTIIDAIGILKKQISKKGMQNILNVMDEQIRAGNSFSDAIKIFHQHFSSLYISLVKAGEASGKLGKILLKLAENLEKDKEIRGRLRAALIYPVVIILAMVVVMFIMLAFVMPKLLELYKEFNVALPLQTQILIALSDFTAKYWVLILGSMITAVVFTSRYLKSKAGKFVFYSTALKLPVLGNVIKKSTLVDATRTLSLLIASGVPILDSLKIITEATDNVVFQTAFKNAAKNVEKGTSLGDALSYEEVFPPILVQMTQVGESTGHLDDTLGRLSKYFEVESEIAIKTMTTLIEPTILVALGLGVGFLVISVITPIYNFTSTFQ